MVSICGEQSESVDCISGVAQGSIVGPNLFNFYISPVLTLPVSDTTWLVAYADDLLVIKPINSSSDCDNLQTDLDLIVHTYSDLFLSINPSKCQYLICTLREPHLQQILPKELSISGRLLERVESMKYLGVTLDYKQSYGKNTEFSSLRTKKSYWSTLAFGR